MRMAAADFHDVQRAGVASGIRVDEIADVAQQQLGLFRVAEFVDIFHRVIPGMARAAVVGEQGVHQIPQDMVECDMVSWIR